MKNKLISIALLYSLAYLLPLVDQLSLLGTVQMGLLSLISACLAFTQPPLSIAESQATKHNDRFSTWVIVVGYVFCKAISVAEWAYYRPDAHLFSFDLITIVGLLLIVGGVAFRLWSIRLLGNFFTATVQTQVNQRIIRAGAYRLIRHPSYLGAYLVVVGSAVLLHAYVGLLISLVVMFLAYWYRIDAEEETLVRVFGREYTDYQQQSKKLFPFIY